VLRRVALPDEMSYCFRNRHWTADNLIYLARSRPHPNCPHMLAMENQRKGMVEH
jgi:hypothetical protein